MSAEQSTSVQLDKVQSASLQSAVSAGTPIMFSIVRTHYQRLGFWRTLIGGHSMYLTIPLFIFLHITVVTVMYRVLLAPLLGLPRLDSSRYIILDRHRIEPLHWFDKFNCLFCSYANGIIKLMNDELDGLASSRARAPVWAMPFVELYALVNAFLLVIGLVMSTVVLQVIAKCLGLHRGSMRRIKSKLLAQGYAAHYSPRHRGLILFYKMVAMVVAYNLEQIESAWCPLKHLPLEGRVFPEHHDRFYDRDALDDLHRVLAADGTVSQLKPKPPGRA